MRSWCAHTSSALLTLSLSPKSNYPLPKAYCCCFHYGFPTKSRSRSWSRRKAPSSVSIAIRCSASPSSSSSSSPFPSQSNNNNKIWQAEIDNFVVVNFYRFVFIKDPQNEVAKHLSFLEVCIVFLRLNSFSLCSAKHFICLFF